MTMNLDDQKKESGDHKDNHYPLEMYIKKMPTMELSVDFSTLGKFPLSEDDLKKLQEIKALVKSAEEEINTITSKSARQDGEVFHIEQPSYFDDNFDQDKYVRDLVNAKFQGMKIIEHENAATKVQKIILLKKAIDKMNDEDSESSEAITIQRAPNVYRVKMENNVTTNKNQKNKLQDGTNNSQNSEQESEKVVKVTSKEILQVDENEHSDERIKKISKSNHRIIEIKSMETESVDNSQIQRQLTVSKMPGLTVEVMPSINIRSQLIEQKIPSLDIFPTDVNNFQPNRANNIAVLNTEHHDIAKICSNEVKAIEPKKKLKENVQVSSITHDDEKKNDERLDEGKNIKQKTSQRRTKSSDKIHDIPSHSNKTEVVSDEETKNNYMFLNKKYDNQMFNEILSRKISRLKKYGIPEIQQIYNPKTQIYKGCAMTSSRPFTSSNKYLSNITKQPVFLRKDTSRFTNDRSIPSTSQIRIPPKEYIPYSKLTIGGYMAKDAERIMKSKTTESQTQSFVPDVVEDEGNEGEYLEDKEDSSEENLRSESEKSEESKKSEQSDDNSLEKYLDDFDVEDKSDGGEGELENEKAIKDKTVSLGFKSKVDVFDFVNYVQTKDDSTQSSPMKSVSYRETQTSPEQEDNNNETMNVDKDDNVNVTKTFDVSNITLADMIQIQKVLSTLNLQFSNNPVERDENKVEQDDKLEIPYKSSNTSIPKDTQTSPYQSKHAVTSPISILGESLLPTFDEQKIDIGTSPFEFESQIEKEKSPRKLPVDYSMPGVSGQSATSISPKKSILKESTDAFTDVSHSESSETHSLGEINLRILRKRSFIIKKHHTSDSTSTSLGLSSSSDVHLDSSNHYVPMRSEGEISEGQILKDV